MIPLRLPPCEVPRDAPLTAFEILIGALATTSLALGVMLSGFVV